MEPDSQPQISTHDATLIDWFLSLQPTERLAELESRLAFFNSVRPDADTQLSIPLDEYPDALRGAKEELLIMRPKGATTA